MDPARVTALLLSLLDSLHRPERGVTGLIRCLTHSYTLLDSLPQMKLKFLFQFPFHPIPPEN
jgi:hypothetical protein